MRNLFWKLGLLVIGAWLLGTSPAHAAPDIRLATTTSTDNSGLLPYLLPAFEKTYGGKVRVIATGSGKAMKLGENGDVDVVLVHSRPDEDKFVAQGFGVNRRDVMHNDFIVVGPVSDPAHIKGDKSVIDAFRKIAAARAPFISRGDDSGTDKMEKRYWQQTGIKPQGNWYKSAGLGMGEVLTMAGETRAYTLTDRGTYVPYKAKTGLDIMVQGDPRLFNPYGVIAVNPKRFPHVNYQGAMAFIHWLTSPEGQRRIASFKVNGQQLFFPDALQGTGQRHAVGLSH